MHQALSKIDFGITGKISVTNEFPSHKTVPNIFFCEPGITKAKEKKSKRKIHVVTFSHALRYRQGVIIYEVTDLGHKDLNSTTHNCGICRFFDLIQTLKILFVLLQSTVSCSHLIHVHHPLDQFQSNKMFVNANNMEYIMNKINSPHKSHTQLYDHWYSTNWIYRTWFFMSAEPASSCHCHNTSTRCTTQHGGTFSNNYLSNTEYYYYLDYYIIIDRLFERVCGAKIFNHRWTVQFPLCTTAQRKQHE